MEEMHWAGYGGTGLGVSMSSLGEPLSPGSICLSAQKLSEPHPFRGFQRLHYIGMVD